MIVDFFNNMAKRIALFSETAPISNEAKTRLQHYVIFLMLGVPTMTLFSLYSFYKGNTTLALIILPSAIALLTGIFVVRTLKDGTWVYRINAIAYMSLLIYMIMIGGDGGSKALWSYTWPLISCFLFGYIEGSLWSILLLLITLIAYNSPMSQFVERYDYSPDFLLRFLITYSICAALASWFEYSRAYYRQESNQKNLILDLEHRKLKKEIATRKALQEQLVITAKTDSLTGILNRGAFWENAEQEWDKHQHTANTISFAILDIDHFKRINDTFGHPAGDEVIRQVVNSALSCIRTVDIIGRIGGEEFAIIMLKTSSEDASKIANRIRSTVSQQDIRYQQDSIKCTVSCGVYSTDNDQLSLDSIYQKADQLLYLAKKTGRNQVVIEKESCLLT
ncbi:GGDEF domain-containing protein [Neptunomonas japonica]|uniref:GGDEF domain-containing protein n=1 Tax=Neptunomonas japonica TaxID=417574 RepID=UPI0003FF7235|nr:GGDEF domain-containing protein [Neptunomonas japonica]